MPTVSATRTRQAPLSTTSSETAQQTRIGARGVLRAHRDPADRARACPTISGRPLRATIRPYRRGPEAYRRHRKWEVCTNRRHGLGSRSRATARHQAVMRQGRPRLAMARRSARSSASMAGVPASNSGTPAAASAAAMAHFSAREKITPGACSPSLYCCRSDGPGFTPHGGPGDQQRLRQLALGERIQHFVDALFVPSCRTNGLRDRPRSAVPPRRA